MKIRSYIAIFCAFLLLFAACNSKNNLENTQIEQLSKSKDGGDAVSHDASDTARLYVYSVDCDYIGDFNGKQCVVHLFSSTESEMRGAFYIVDNENLIMQAHKFEVKTNNTEYIANLQGTEAAFNMKYNANDEELRAVLELKGLSKSGKEEKTAENIVKLSFTKVIPDKIFPQSDRYKKTLFAVKIDSNVVYGKAKGAWTSLHVEPTANYAKELLPYLFKASNLKMLDLTMDVYQPVGDTLSMRPAIVLFHGGAFFFGDKHDSEMIAWCSHLASLGYVVFSVNYRMGFEPTKASIQKCGFKAIQDGHAALRYVAHNATKYRIDPDWIYAGGSSAGSIVAMNILYMDDQNAPKATRRKHFAKVQGSLHDSGNNLTDEFKIKGLINMWGALYEISDLKKSPVAIISFHGTADKVVPYAKGYPFSQLSGKDGKGGLGGMLFDEMYGSKAIHDALRGVPVHQEFYALKDCGHAPYRNKETGDFNENYYFIQNKMSKFLNDDLVYDIAIDGVPSGAVGVYRLVNCGAAQVHWYVEGGVVLRRTGYTATVRFFSDAPKHVLRVSGLLRNGATFTLDKDFDKQVAEKTI